MVQDFLQKRTLYIKKSSFETFVSKELYNEWKNSGKNMLKYMKVPIKIICGGNSSLFPKWKKIINKIPIKNEFIIIDGAGHSFNEEGVDEKLFEETLKWIK